jgi:hypothetical protein
MPGPGPRTARVLRSEAWGGHDHRRSSGEHDARDAGGASRPLTFVMGPGPRASQHLRPVAHGVRPTAGGIHAVNDYHSRRESVIRPGKGRCLRDWRPAL